MLGAQLAFRGSSAREARAKILVCMYIYIYISIYNCGPLSRSQGSKPGISRRASGAKNDFLLGPVSESTFGRLQDTRKRVPRVFGTAFGVFWEGPGIAQTCDSV